MKNRQESLSEHKQKKHIYRVAWALSVPALILVSLWHWYPFALSFVLGFARFHVIRPSTFIGLENFKSLILEDWMTPLVFLRTFQFAGLSIGLTFLIPIMVSILLMEMKPKTIRIMMILWFIPIATMAGIMVWKWFYNIEFGLFNSVLTFLGLPRLRWLSSRNLAMICLILPGITLYGPGLIYIAMLQSIPQEFYQAADLEGAGLWTKIWHITLPRLRPIIAMMLLLSVTGSLNVFDRPFVMTGGGPVNATKMVMLYVYDIAFRDFKFGRATALSILLFFVSITLVIIQRKYFKENIDK